MKALGFESFHRLSAACLAEGAFKKSIKDKATMHL